MKIFKLFIFCASIALIFGACGGAKKTTKTSVENDTETTKTPVPEGDTLPDFPDFPDFPDQNNALVHVVYPRTAAETTDICGSLPFEKTYIKLDGSSNFLGMSGKLNKEQHYDADGFCNCLQGYEKSKKTDEFMTCLEVHRYIAALNYPNNTSNALRQCSKSDTPMIESHKVFDVLDFQFNAGNADVCGMKDKLLAGQYGTYKNEGVCKCLNQYCGDTEQTDKFIKCIAQYKNEE